MILRHKGGYLRHTSLITSSHNRYEVMEIARYEVATSYVVVYVLTSFQQRCCSVCKIY